MAGVTFRPLPVWPYPERERRYGSRFGNDRRSGRSLWDAALDLLQAEVEAIDGDDVVIGVVADPAAISFSGALKGGTRAVRYRGVEVSFDVPGLTRRVFHTDTFDDVAQNLRAIGLGLEALRAVNRYGITSGTEQYAGFAMLTAGETIEERGRRLVEAAGSIRKALAAHHPDRGGSADDAAAVSAYQASLREPVR